MSQYVLLSIFHDMIKNDTQHIFVTIPFLGITIDWGVLSFSQRYFKNIQRCHMVDVILLYGSACGVELALLLAYGCRYVSNVEATGLNIWGDQLWILRWLHWEYQNGNYDWTNYVLNVRE